MSSISSDHARSSAAPIDPSALESLRELGGSDDPGLLLELIQLFLEDGPKRLSEIKDALKRQDFAAAERAAHTLKSSSANLGAMGLSGCCKQMEEAARQRRLEGLTALFTESETCWSSVEAALRAVRA